MPEIPPNHACLLCLGGFHGKPRRHPWPHLPPLICLTDAARFPDPLPIAAQLPRESLVIFRHYQTAGRRELAHRLASFCRSRGLRFLVAGDAALAIETHADGLHLPEWLARGPVSRGWGWRQRKPGWLLTAAAHCEMSLARAARAGADAVLLAPVFPTTSHPGADGLGVLRFATLAHRTDVPVYGLGGINIGTVRRLRGAGAAGIAVVSALAKENDRHP